MQSYIIEGGYPLKGEIRVQGSKNAVLPLVAAALLNEGTTVLNGCPDISDVDKMLEIIRHFGCEAYQDRDSGTITINAASIHCEDIPEDMVRSFRGSMLFMGVMLARCGHIEMNYPGGCMIGERPVNYHLDAFREMGADVVYGKDNIVCTCKTLKGCKIALPFPSVGATENIILAAVKAVGTTMIINAAMEPEVAELCNMLCLMGADIKGIGSKIILIRKGIEKRNIRYTVMSDRIVVGTYAYAAAVTGGDISCIVNRQDIMTGISVLCKRMGIRLKYGNDYVRIISGKNITSIPYIKTEPYPGFPTDMQSQLMSVLSLGNGMSVIEESIFEKRYHIVSELLKMGADIRTEGNRAYICGVKSLKGAKLEVKDLRGGAALIIAGLAADGTTTVLDPGYIDRGYEKIADNLSELGGNIHLA